MTAISLYMRLIPTLLVTTLSLEVFLVPHSYIPGDWLQDRHVVGM